MKHTIIPIASIILVGLFFSCKHDPKAPALPTIGSHRFDKKGGPDCDKPDTLRVNCVEILLKYPVVEEGNDALKQSVSAWAGSYLSSILAFEDTIASKPLDAAANSFIESQKQFAVDAEGSPMASWSAESWDTVLLNDGKHLTLEIVGYVYAGGAHGSPTAAVATFEVGTGRQLRLYDMVTDTTALKTLLEKKYREARPDLFQPTDGSEPFRFDDIFSFELPQNYGLLKDGIYCHYLHYEVGPYAIGNTQFVLPFSEMGALSKIK